MENKINVKIKQCYDTEENYKNNNPILLEGQLAYTKDKYGKYKVGDGISHWNDLDYTENIFIGTQKEYEEKNANGEITPGTVVYITDDNDYYNIPVDDYMSEENEHVVYNKTITKALRLNNASENCISADITPAESVNSDYSYTLPAAGSVNGSISNLGDWLSSHRSGFYTMQINNTWYNVISNRHGNGLSDGTNYGMVFYTHLTNSNDSLLWDSQAAGIWRGQHTILDNVNYSDFITTLNLTGTVNTSTTTTSHLNGAKGINVGLNMTASGNGYNMIAKVNSTGGVFNIGQWEDRFELFYITQSLINNNSNGYTYRATLLNQNGDSNFPGIVNASQFKASGTNMNISGGLVTQLETGTTRIFKNGIAISNPATKNDQGWIRVTGSGESDTILEIATGDDGGTGEQIVVRQYNTSNNIARQAILLNTSGNTSFPGTVSASAFSGNATSATKILDRGTHGEAASGTSTPAPQAGMLDSSGMYMTRGYNSANTPSAYGNVINLAGGGSGQIFCSWNGGNNASTGYMYYRSHTDCSGSGAGWGPWYRLLDTRDSSSFAYSSHSHNRVDSTTYIGSGSANYITQLSGSVTQVRGNGGLELFVNDNSPWIQIKNLNRDLGVALKWGGTAFSPNYDNRLDLGGSGDRWKQVYAANSSISTSDRKQKKEISYIGQKTKNYEDTYMDDITIINFINKLKPVVFKRIDGESGRPHHGLIAQDVEEILHEFNIDHAAFIKSPVEEVKEIKDENGNVIDREKIIKEDEFIYGMRYEEFVSDIIRYSQILYKKNEELEEQLKEKNKQIHNLSNRLFALEEKIDALLSN